MIVFLLVYFILHCESLHPEKCQQLPAPAVRHCLIEYRVRDRWPHTLRYVYNWYTRSCFEIRWSKHCPDVPDPTTDNNFSTESECLEECGGWA